MLSQVHVKVTKTKTGFSLKTVPSEPEKSWISIGSFYRFTDHKTIVVYAEAGQNFHDWNVNELSDQVAHEYGLGRRIG